MIIALSALDKQYKNKKKYIWNVNRDSMVVFIWLAFAKADIQGFVTDHEYIGELYMNRPVIDLKEIECDKDAVLFVSENISKDVFDMLPEHKTVYWKDAMQLNEELMQKKVIVYGIGDGAERLCGKLAEHGIEPSLFCVTKKELNVQFHGRNVIEADELGKYEDHAVLISVINRQHRREIRTILEGFGGQVYVELNNILDPVMVQEVNFVQNIDLAIKSRKKVYLYSKRSSLAKMIEDVLHVYGVDFRGYVYDKADEQQEIESIFDLAYEGIDDKFIILNEDLPECFSYGAYVRNKRNASAKLDEKASMRFIKSRENVELAGFSLEKSNYTSLQWYAMASEYFLLNLLHEYDPLVGYSLPYSKDIPGWKLYGKGRENSIRIAVLGGSTSSEILHTGNWVSKLYCKLRRAGIQAVIYNGAHGDNDIVDEILRLMRDGTVLKPHIVISMSGVNNLHYKDSSNQFNPKALCYMMKSLAPSGKYCSGIYNDESLYSFWVRNIRLMKTITEFFGGRFYGFLQPVNLTMRSMSLWEKSLFELEADVEGAESFMQSAGEGEDYINLLNLFEHMEGMYIDACHYTDKANEIIAAKVYEEIMPVVKNMQNDTIKIEKAWGQCDEYA